MKRKGILLLLTVSFLITGCAKQLSQEPTATETARAVIAKEQEIEYFTVDTQTPMENRGLKLEIWGSGIYDKIEGNSFTDIPEEGKKYLVLFLSITNRTGKEDYFNYNNITAKLDGKELTDTFLINDPEGYQSIKTNLPDEYITQGYLVWEVPETWKKLEVTYSGWTQSYYTEPTIILTPDVLKTPETYNSDNSII